jgi:hypothetical protein
VLLESGELACVIGTSRLFFARVQIHGLVKEHTPAEVRTPGMPGYRLNQEYKALMDRFNRLLTGLDVFGGQIPLNLLQERVTEEILPE